MNSPFIRVVKIGGSLFDYPSLNEHLQAWLAQQPPATNVLIAGGGKLAQSIRQLDRLHAIGEIASHWLCVRAMGVTARMLVDMLSNAALVDDLNEFQELVAVRPMRTCVFDAMPLLSTSEPNLPGTVLPHGWVVTSDSIAARVAEILTASELVLLKSGLPESDSFEQLAQEGYVDEFFPVIASKISQVRCVNLRSQTFAQRSLRA